ncbi:MAG: DUF4956 domain-containing protein [Planctomycetota bacterium]
MNLQEWLKSISDFGVRSMEETGLPAFLLALGISLLSALFVAYLYVVFYRSRAAGTEVHRAFPLLGLSITAIFIAIQFSLPLSLGLLGALSIVRFRTPIKEPEEISFVMLVVATSLSCATFNFLFLALVLGGAVVALLAMRALRGMTGKRAGAGMLVVQVPSGEYRERADELLGYLERELPAATLDSVTEGEASTSIGYRCVGLDPARIAALQRDLRGIAPGASSSVYVERESAA